MSAPAPPPSPRTEGGRGGSSPAPRPRRRKISESRRLKLRHSSSRSGGPWLPPPGPCGPREPPRPQLGSFKDIALEAYGFFGRLALGRARRAELGDGAAQRLQTCAGASAHVDAGNPTILVALHSRLEARGVDLVPDDDARRFIGADLGEHLVHFGCLRIARG